MTDQSIPSDVAVCPYCGGQLYFDVDEWDAQTGVPTETGVHVSCVNDEDKNTNHYDMPYVYWMPLEQRIHRWLVATGYTVPLRTPDEERAALAAWNEAQPIRYGPRSWDVWEPGKGWRSKR